MLVVADIVLVTTVDSYLLTQVDARLEAAGPPVSRGRPHGPGGGGGGPGEGSEPSPPASPSGPGRDESLTELFIASLTRDGTVVEQVAPGFRDSSDPPPRLDLDVVRGHAGHGHPGPPFTVPAAGDGPSYRVTVNAYPEGGYLVVGLSLRDTEAVSR